MRPHSLPFSPPRISEAAISAVTAALRSGWIGTGPLAKEFESKFAEYVGAEHAAAVSSCTTGLFLTLKALGVGPGDEIITTSMTFCSTVNSILHCGARPILVDVDPATGNIDLEQVEAKIGPKTVGILPVHYTGYPVDMVKLMEIATRHKLLVVEDCAHAIETEINSKHVGTFGNAGVFSFYATKNISIGEGGMVVSNDEELIARVAQLSLHGLSRGAWKRFSEGEKRTYDVEEIGYKANFTDVQAAIGLAQLDELEQNYRHRENLWAQYIDGLSDLDVRLPAGPSEVVGKHALHLFVINLGGGKNRDELVESFSSQHGLALGVHYQAISQFRIYRDVLNLRVNEFPIAEAWGSSCVSLSMSAGTSTEHAQQIVDALRATLS